MTYRTNNFKAEVPSFSIEDTIEEFEKQGLLGNHPIVEDVQQTLKEYRSVLTKEDGEMMLRKVLDSLTVEANALLQGRNAPYLIVSKRQFRINNCGAGWFNLRTLLVKKGKFYDKTLERCSWYASPEFRIRVYIDSDSFADYTSNAGEVVVLFQKFVVRALKLVKVVEAIAELKKKRV